MIDARKVMFGLDEALAVYLGLNRIWVNKPYDAELTYLQSSGTLYIDTGLVNAANVVVDIKMSGLGTDVLNGVETSTSNKYKWGIGGSGNPYIGYGSTNNNYNYGTAVTLDDVFVYHIEKGLLSISDASGNILSSSTATLSTYATSTITLFRMRRSGSLTTTSGSMRIYRCTITIDGVAHEFIPVRVGSVGYIYDKYNKLLFGNIGIGNFTLGPDKVIYDAEIEYLQSNGTQYIDLNTIPDADTGLYVKILRNSSYNDKYAIGLRDTVGDTRWCISCSNNNGWYYGYGGYAMIANTDNKNLLSEVLLNYLNSKNASVIASKGTGTKALPTLSFTPEHNIRIFGSSGVNDNYTKFYGDIHRMKVSQGDRIIYDLIPVRKNSIGYMYDKVREVLLGNDGTGDFVLGPDKVSMELNYTKLEYIESTADGGQYIDLNVKLYETLGTNYDVAIKFNIFGPGKNNATNAAIFACLSVTSPWPGTFIRKTGGNTNEVVGRYIGADIKDNVLGTTNTVIELPAKTPPEKNIYSLNNSNNLTHSFGTSLFCVFSNTSNDPKDFTHARLYYFKLFVEGVLIRDMVPCKNNITNVIGLYDKANDVFYTSPNGAVFVAGPELNYTELEYVESTGTQYIDTGFKPNTKSVIVDTEVAITDMTQDGIILGAIDNENDIRYYLIGFNNEHFYVKNDSGSSNLSLLSPVSITLNEFNTIHSKLASSALISVSNTVSSSLASVAKFNDSKSLYLFANNSSSPSNLIKCKIKYLKIYEDDVLIRDFVPCKNSNDIVGLYDRINNIFYSSQTSLVAGPEILS